MALSVPTYDPQTTAENLAAAFIQKPQAMLDSQTKGATQVASGLTTLSSAMSAFSTALLALSAKKSVVANTATFSSTVGTATASATATAGKYSFYVERIATANQASFANLPDGAAASGTITIEGGGVTFDVDLAAADVDGNGLSVKELAKAINAHADNEDGVTASVMTIDGKQTLVLTSNKTGTENAVTVTANDPGDSFGAAFADADNRKDLVEAQNALVYVGSKTGTPIEQASNTFDVIDGVSMTFTAAQTGTEPVTLTVGKDDTATAANVQAFVDAYNKLASVLNTLTANADPEAGTTAGTFASDSGITAMRSRLQALVRESTGGTSLISYGITAQRDGALKLDTARLSKQLAANPEGLDSLFGKASSTAPTGVLGGLDKLMSQWTNSATGQIATRRESNTKLQSSLTDRQDRLTRQYNDAYDRYLAQFTALQTLQSQMTSNSTLFDALFSSSDD